MKDKVQVDLLQLELLEGPGIPKTFQDFSPNLIEIQLCILFTCHWNFFHKRISLIFGNPAKQYLATQQQQHLNEQERKCERLHPKQL